MARVLPFLVVGSGLGASACTDTAQSGARRPDGAAGATTTQPPADEPVDELGDCDSSAAELGRECVNESAAIFVWEPGAYVGPVQGSYAFSGTRERPVATLSRAVGLAVEQRKSLVIACGTTLMGGLVAEGVAAAVRIVGGFSCPDDTDGGWKPTGERTRLILETLAVTAPYDGHAVVAIRNSPGGITLENFSLNFAPDLRDSPYGVQRIGAIVEKASVVLKNVHIEVAGGDAAFTPITDKHAYPDAMDLNASQSEGAPGCSVTCVVGGTTSGGRGGWPCSALPVAASSRLARSPPCMQGPHPRGSSESRSASAAELCSEPYPARRFWGRLATNPGRYLRATKPKPTRRHHRPRSSTR